MPDPYTIFQQFESPIREQVLHGLSLAARKREADAKMFSNLVENWDHPQNSFRNFATREATEMMAKAASRDVLGFQLLASTLTTPASEEVAS